MASSLNLAGKWGCCVGSCLKRKRGAYPPTHKRASLAFLLVFQRTRREGDEETKTEIKRRAEAIAILTAPASQSVRSGCDGSTRWICEKQLGNFYFSPLCSPGYRQNTSGKFLWETKQRMQKKRGKLFCFFSPCDLSSVISVYVCVCWGEDLRESGMSHELLSASWNSLFKCDWCTVHVCSCYYRCLFFHLLSGYWCGKMG